MRKLTLQPTLVLMVFIGACSNPSIFTTSDDTVPTETLETDTPAEFKGPNDYDLSLYLFHTNTQTVGGEISFIEKYYDKSGNGPIHTQAIRYLNSGISIDSVGSDNAVLLQYVVTINTIKEIGVANNSLYGFSRYAALNELYYDSLNEDLGRRDTCTLQNHLEEFNLGDATGSATIASGVYEDVLHVFCKRVLDQEDESTLTNYSWNGYYAKGVGLIFADGNWIILDADRNWLYIGDAYLIPDY